MVNKAEHFGSICYMAHYSTARRFVTAVINMNITRNTTYNNFDEILIISYLNTPNEKTSATFRNDFERWIH